jgi:hypothetical protein
MQICWPNTNTANIKSRKAQSIQGTHISRMPSFHFCVLGAVSCSKLLLLKILAILIQTLKSITMVNSDCYYSYHGSRGYCMMLAMLVLLPTSQVCVIKHRECYVFLDCK